MSALVAIIGRPNVGKSTLFNRLVGKKLAIVDDQPGVTRDRRYAPGSLGGLEFTLIDTAGMERAADDALETRMLAQTKAAIKEADLCLLLIDARAGVTPADEYFAQMVRRSGKPTLLLLNKAEGKAGLQTAYDAYALGLGDPILISAEHGEGLGDFYQALEPAINKHAPKTTAPEDIIVPEKKKKLRAAAAQKQKQNARDMAKLAQNSGDDLEEIHEAEEGAQHKNIPMQIAIVGRPNAGKSTLINALLGQERLLTGPEAGITRDAIAVDMEYDGRALKLIDTAGMRKKANVVEKLESMSVGDTLRAITYAHVVVVLMDATIPFERQDNAITALIEREGRAIVIGLSKWDLVGLDAAQSTRTAKGKRTSAEQRAAQKLMLEELRLQCDEHLPQIKGVPLIPLSAHEGMGLHTLMEACFSMYEVWNTRVSTAALNRFLDDAEQTHTPPMIAGRRVKMKYMTQTKTRPPTFQIFTNLADDFPESYARYLINGLRHVFGLFGVPIRLSFTTSHNPYQAKRRQK